MTKCVIQYYNNNYELYQGVPYFELTCLKDNKVMCKIKYHINKYSKVKAYQEFKNTCKYNSYIKDIFDNVSDYSRI